MGISIGESMKKTPEFPSLYHLPTVTVAICCIHCGVDCCPFTGAQVISLKLGIIGGKVNCWMVINMQQPVVDLIISSSTSESSGLSQFVSICAILFCSIVFCSNLDG